MRLGCHVVLLMAIVASSFAQNPDPKLYEDTSWRLVGPSRGGRSVAVSGVPGRKDEFYMGTCGGGLWKSTNAGTDWECVSDGFFATGSVGGIGVSTSNPDTVYVGMGECDIRGNITHGDGVYKSTDGGKTWVNVGLKETRYIGKVRVHPTDPNTVYVAALGHVYGSNKERGLFKTTDGGRTWQNVLFVSDRAGAIDVSIDAKNPETLYVATWETFRTPYSLSSGGPGSKLFKSTDGGKHWEDLSTKPGLPSGVLGKIGVCVSPANSNRVWAEIEALEGGIFRSDDGGKTWQMMNNNRNYRQRAWYYTHVIADTKDENGLYVLNVGAGRSSDGGKTFSGMSAPHGDNHDLWIDPADPERMILGNDGGASVSIDKGRTWTDVDFPTAQIYHVQTDNAVPYHILGAQQDNSTIRILAHPKRTNGAREFESTAGGESGFVAAKPDDAEIVYGGSYGGDLSMLNHRTGESRSVDPWPDNPMGHGAIDSAQRFQWTFPIVFSPHNPDTLYTCSQFVLKSTNGGQSWKKISPDLTRNDPATMLSSGGPITKDNTGVEVYGTVFTFAESPRRKGLLWAGSDDGLVHVSLNGGGKWDNVTPPQMPKWGLCSTVEASPCSDGKAFLAVDNHENDDHAPYIFRTSDFGKTWSLIVSGIPKDTFVRVVREDPKREGLLYAGTETGVFVSFNDGNTWTPFQKGLPNTPVHDLVIKGDDLIAATHGRSFWMVEGLRSVRNAEANMPAIKLYSIGDVFRTSPRLEAAYYVSSKAANVKLEVFNSEGKLVKSSEATEVEPGIHDLSVTLNYPGYRSFPNMIFWAAGPGPIAAPPGTYKARLTVDGKTAEQTFRITKNPRSRCTDEDGVLQFELAMKISKRVDEANEAVIRIREAKKALGGKPENETMIAKLSAIEEEIYQVKNQSGQDPLNYPIKLNNKLAALLGVVQSGDFRPTEQSYEVFEILSKQLQKQLDELSKLLKKG